MTKIDRPVGLPVATLPPGIVPDLRPLNGRYSRLEALDVAKHGADLWAVHAADEGGLLWTYFGNEPPTSEKAFVELQSSRALTRDPWHYAYINLQTGKALGTGAFMRFDKANGVIEIGYIWFSTALQRTREASEVIYLMMHHAFDDLGCRRLEWKCDSLNAASRRAAERFGFTYEGTFRQHMVSKGRNRDTAWFSMLDSEWPRVKADFETWLAESNFDAAGQQKAKLQLT